MATKKSLYLSDGTEAWIKSTTKSTADESPKWSESINETFNQFRYLLKTSLPELTPSEWQVILNVYAGCYMPAHGVPARIASDIMDDMGVCDINAMDTVMRDLVMRLHALNQTEQLAILYVVQLFWANCWSDYPDFDAILAKIKTCF